MAKTLDEIRAKLQAMENRRSPGNFSGGDKSMYPHWNMPEGTSSIQRFLPDANQDNTFFWAERQIIKLPFPGIKGQDENKPVIVQVPCIEMWDGPKTCPILNEVRPWWKDKSLEETARKYWLKRTYYMQGFVKQDPLNESEKPENPIRKFIIGPQIFAIIKAALLDPEMGPHSPVDYINGVDFVISKTSKGGFADYGTSKWARKESSITEEMQEAINKHGLVDLSTYLPKRPSKEQLAIIYEMFQESVDGELYDPERFSQHYKPFGFDAGDDSEGGERQRVGRSSPQPTRVQVQTTAPVKTVVPMVEDDNDPPFDVDPPKELVTETVKTDAKADKSPQEILAMLRNRNK
jgi:gp32 DNA binding protein like